MTNNPLHSIDLEGVESGVGNGSGLGSGELHRRKRPSAAYMKSYEKAIASKTYIPRDARDGVGSDVFPGWKSVLASVVLLVSGIVFFITGAVFFWGSDGTEKHAQGKDILIVGSILLLPGAFSCYIYFGAWMKWQGFKYSQVPSLHFDDEPVEE